MEVTQVIRVMQLRRPLAFTCIACITFITGFNQSIVTANPIV